MLRLLQALSVLIAAMILLGGGRFSVLGYPVELGVTFPWILLTLGIWFLGSRLKRTWAGDYRQWIRRWLARLVSRPRNPWALSVVLLSVFGLGLGLSDLTRHWTFGTTLFDTGYTHSALFFPWRDGHLLHSPISPLKSFIVDHFCPSLVVPGLLFQFLHSSELVIIFQTLLVIGGTFLLVRFGPLESRPRLAALSVVILLCSRAFFHVAIDFREDHLAFFSLCLALIGLQQSKELLFFSGLILFLGSKEHTALLALGVLPLIFSNQRLIESGRRRVWLSSAGVLILTYAALAYGVFIPRLQAPLGESVGQVNQRLGVLGASLPEIFLSPILRPAVFWPWLGSRFLDASVPRYLFLVLAPYGLFLIRAPHGVLAASIGILGNIIPERPEQRGIHWHYDLAFAPFLMMGLLEGLRSVSRIRHWKWGVVLALLVSLRWPAFDLVSKWPSTAEWSDSRAFSTLSCEGTLAADERSLGHLSRCPELRWFKPRSNCSDASEAWKSARNYRSSFGVSGESSSDANRLVLDRSDPCLNRIANWLLSTGSQADWHSPSGRFIAISRLP